MSGGAEDLVRRVTQTQLFPACGAPATVRRTARRTGGAVGAAQITKLQATGARQRVAKVQPAHRSVCAGARLARTRDFAGSADRRSGLTDRLTSTDQRGGTVRHTSRHRSAVALCHDTTCTGQADACVIVFTLVGVSAVRLRWAVGQTATSRQAAELPTLTAVTPQPSLATTLSLPTLWPRIDAPRATLTLGARSALVADTEVTPCPVWQRITRPRVRTGPVARSEHGSTEAAAAQVVEAVIEGATADAGLAPRDPELAILVPGARLHAAVVPVVEKLASKAGKPLSALVSALTRLHLSGATSVFRPGFVAATTPVVAASDGAVDLIAQVGLRDHLVKAAVIDLVARAQTAAGLASRLSFHAGALKTTLDPVAKSPVITLRVFQAVTHRTKADVLADQPGIDAGARAG